MLSINKCLTSLCIIFLFQIIITTAQAAESQKEQVAKIAKEIESKLKTSNSFLIATDIKNNEEKSVDGFHYILNCSECHGFDGNSNDPQWPNIAGLNKDYITRQLEDFKTGKRLNEEMTHIVKEFPSDKELISLADFFSKQKVKNPNTPANIKKYKLVNLSLGEEIFTGKRIEYGIPACSACHGKNGLGDKGGKYPRLAGQYMGYIIKQMELFRSKERNNDTPAQMRNIASQMDDEDIASVAAYIAYMDANKQ